MAAVIIILSKRATLPTKAEIADVLGVEVRTVQRWLAELRAAGVMSYQQVGKRRLYVFHEDPTITDPSITDRTISDPHAISDRAISDRAIIHEIESGSADHGPTARSNGRTLRQAISDRSGGGGSHGKESIPELPTTNPRRRTKVLPEQIETPTGRWLVKIGMNIGSAYRFQNIPLEVAQRDIDRRRELGQGNGAIVLAWSVELPEFDLLGETPAAEISAARRAELQAKYGDLFLFSGDPIEPQEGAE